MASSVASEPRVLRAALAGVVAFACLAGDGCIYLTGVQDYEKGACEGPCADAGSDAPDAAGPCPAGMQLVAGGSYVRAWKPSGGLVAVGSVCADRTEVTEAAYRGCVEKGTCTATPAKAFCNYAQTGRESDPINCIDVTQATTFCAAQGKRLPTEDEWEWVARGGTLGLAYPWGNAAPTATDDPELLCWSGKVNRNDDTLWPKRPAGTCPAGSYPKGGHDSIVDLVGNVWEWTATPGDGSTFIARGGSAFDDPTDATKFRAGSRLQAASATYPAVGVRCFSTPR